MSATDTYDDLIFDHVRHPRYALLLTTPDRTATEVSRLCGDQVTVTISGDAAAAGQLATIAAIGVQCRGCALARASASLMAEALAGRSAESARALLAAFPACYLAGVSGDPAGEADPAAAPQPAAPAAMVDFPGAEALLSLRRFATRESCVLLPWRCAAKALTP